MASGSWTRRRRLKTAVASAAAGALTSRFTGILGAAGSAVQGSAQAGSAVYRTDRPTYGQTATGRPTYARERLLADFGWKFALGHANDVAKDFGYGRGGAFAKSGSLIGGRGSVTSAAFDDAAWKPVDLPHDWAIDLPFSDDRNLNAHGAKPLGRTFPDTSIGWYRRTFDIPATTAVNAKRRWSITFDGVFRDCMVMLNGHYLGRNMSGYAPFRFDITDFLTYGGKNALVVRVDATEFEGWFYEGAGIYRHVWLEQTEQIHVAHEGVFVTSEVHANGTATVTVQTELENEQDEAATVRVWSFITAFDGTPLPNAADGSLVVLKPWGRHTVTETLTVAKPSLWSIEAPHLYRVATSVLSGGAKAGMTGRRVLFDEVTTTFGIRTIRFDTDKGFFLNGKSVKIKGTCNHQDHAGVGAALPDRLQYFRIEKLKEMGCNAYRTSHNQPTPELLEACDRLGMLVMDETRMMSSNDEGRSQLERMIRRDRNHPSVFCWSIGNEEPEQGTDRGARVAMSMKRWARELDPTRLVTQAMNNSWGRGLSAIVDIQGFNYRYEGIDDYHKRFPKQFVIGTEFGSTVSTRGIYENDTTKGYVSAYDKNYPPWASTAEGWWSHFDARPWSTGGFVWTGFDYRGEPTPYNWPCISSHFGILDLCGFPKDLFYYYRAWWSGEPVLHLFPHWNWTGKEDQEMEVWCFTNCDTVELFVNGVTAGWQKVNKNSHAAWKVRYRPGVIEVRGPSTSLRAGVPVALTARRETTGAASNIVLRPDRSAIAADGEDVSVVAVEIVDAQGRIVPTAMNAVTFNVTGAGRIIGVGNGDPSSHEPDRASARSAFNGLCMALVQSTRQAGEIRVEATSAGLAGTVATIKTGGGPRQIVS